MLLLILILGFLFTAHTTFLSSTAAVSSAEPFDVWLLAVVSFFFRTNSANCCVGFA